MDEQARQERIGLLANQVSYGKRQFQIFMSRVMLSKTIIDTSAYRFENATVGIPRTEEEVRSGAPLQFRAMTEEEKLLRAIEVMKAHIRLMTECSDSLVETENKLLSLRMGKEI